MVFINEMRHGLWVQLRRRSELQQVVRVVEFLPQVPQHLFFSLGHARPDTGTCPSGA